MFLFSDIKESKFQITPFAECADSTDYASLLSTPRRASLPQLLVTHETTISPCSVLLDYAATKEGKQSARALLCLFSACSFRLLRFEPSVCVLLPPPETNETGT